MQVEFVNSMAGDALRAVLVFEDGGRSAGARELGATLDRALGAAQRFKGSNGQTQDLLGLEGGRVLAVGAGAEGGFAAAAMEAAAAQAYQAVKLSGAEVLAIDGRGFSPELVARAALGAELGAYRFARYLTREKREKKPSVTRVQVVADDPDAARRAYEPLAAVAEGVRFARDLVSEPPNILHPEEFARRCLGLTSLWLEVEVLAEAQLAELGMGALLA